eukprot:6913760-Prymnesium_polylepis.1
MEVVGLAVARSLHVDLPEAVPQADACRGPRPPRRPVHNLHVDVTRWVRRIDADPLQTQAPPCRSVGRRDNGRCIQVEHRVSGSACEAPTLER